MFVRGITELLNFAMCSDCPNPILFSELYKKLVSKAQEDGVITEEESNILESVKLAGAEYDQYLAKASDDGIIDEEESAKLKTLRTQMLDAVRAEAQKDYKVSDDERAMLSTFVKILKNLGDFEI